MTKAQVAKEKNMMPELGNATRQIGRLNEYVAQLTPIRDNLSRIGDYLTKIHKNSAYLIEDAKTAIKRTSPTITTKLSVAIEYNLFHNCTTNFYQCTRASFLPPRVRTL